MVVKRTNPSLHLSRTPLIYVVTQVRFSAVMSIEKYVPEIQEKLRKKYPWFQHSKVQEVLLQSPGPPSVGFNDRFEFLGREKQTGIVLTRNSIALHTNKYSNFEHFQDEFGEALAAVHDSVGLGLVERLGLRYVDLVRLGQGESWSDYFQRELLGLDPSVVGVSQWNSQFGSIGKTDVGTLVFRFIQSESPLPPDLTPGALHYEKELLRPGEVGTILDFDHYSDANGEFELDSVMGSIGDLHDNLDRAFRSAVTKSALGKWE